MAVRKHLPADNGLLRRLSYESEMVGSAGNAPVVASSLFEDTGITDRPPDHFPKNGSGGGSCTHGGKAYEAHLNLILPAVKLARRVEARAHCGAMKPAFALRAGARQPSPAASQRAKAGGVGG